MKRILYINPLCSIPSKHFVDLSLLPPQFLLPNFSYTWLPSRGIKSISEARQSGFNKGEGLPRLGSSREAAAARKDHTLPRRSGALATKEGMSAVYDPVTGERRPCTIVQMDRVQVVSQKAKDTHGYYAIQLGSGWKHSSNVTRPLLGHFAKNGVSPKDHLVEFRLRDEGGLLEVGQHITPKWFQEGQFVDVRANSKGKGFAGGMKRHGFKGAPASHGASLSHRAMGSAGQSQGGGSRVLPGKRMAGRMGNEQVTVQSLKVIQIDDEKGFLVLNGKCLSIVLVDWVCL